MINDFSHNGTDVTRGNTGPFWVGSALALFSATITYFFIKPLSHDGMIKEDEEFRKYLEANGYDTSQMGLPDDVTIVEDACEDRGSLGDEKVLKEDEKIAA